MSELVLLVAVVLLLVGVVGSGVPMLPGAPLSLLGVVLYWWSTGFSDPGLVAVFVLTVLGLSAILADLFGGAITARAGGATLVTTGLAAVVGVVLLFLTGPLGLLVGIAGTVFLAEYVRHRDAKAGAKAALFATAGVVGSAAMQLLLTASMFVLFVVAVFL
ncbi:DUF456 domain-containing protein [Halocatena pleomorpha]|uniref:DUF456 domain-containing protein n=1 Tax=Halocatena pleomorpha TaxID=1785090 RepID=A0A3P3R765_9EURY|nr:DUF456 domain-containing protein [Halocatena pleomorpha]RRJ29205.1 DUF456 domain-containing protein [Halocatena pleomorpha]